MVSFGSSERGILGVSPKTLDLEVGFVEGRGRVSDVILAGRRARAVRSVRRASPVTAESEVDDNLVSSEMSIEIALVGGREDSAGGSPGRLVDDLRSLNVFGLGSSRPEPDLDGIGASSHGVGPSSDFVETSSKGVGLSSVVGSTSTVVSIGRSTLESGSGGLHLSVG